MLLYGWSRIGVSASISSLCHSLSVASGKELISLSTESQPTQSLSPWHVMCLRGLHWGGWA